MQNRPIFLKAFYSNLPTAWASTEVKMLDARKRELKDKIKEHMTNFDKGGALFVQGDGGTFFRLLVSTVGISMPMTGIDFADYYDKTLGKSEDVSVDVPVARYTFIYNVGLESALNPAFAERLLQKLVQKVKNNMGWAIVISDMSYTEFRKKYPSVAIKNKIRLPETIEESFT